MPRGKKSDAANPSAVEQRKANLTQLATAYAEDTEDGGSYPAQKMRQGLALDEEKRELFARIATNRRQLRDFVTAGDMAEDDVNLLYPPKKSKDDSGDDTDTPGAA